MEKLLENYFDRLWPICRSITGNGLRESFDILRELIPLELKEVPTGTKAFDWEIPKEWNITDAFILTPSGEKICDFRENNLHIVNYSVPQRREISFGELKAHLHYREDLPDAIPYVTSYYKENWGFCLSYNTFKKLSEKGTYKICIDSSLENGSLTYGQLVLPGKSKKEILFSTYLCHPGMANNELSGPLVLAMLYRKINELKDRKYTYRFIVAPETIGVIAFLAEYGAYLKEHIEAGYVLTCVGDEAPFILKHSKREHSLADRAASHVLKYSGHPFKAIPFSVGGSDERQYCSPGFNMPVASITRSMYQHYPEYHTSLDNKNFISFKAMCRTVELYFDIVQTLELNEKYCNKIPYCEPQLGKRGLYTNTGGTWGSGIEYTRQLLHFLSFADGETDLISLAEKRGLPALSFKPIIEACREKNLI
jgi:aminopeptidase-like protein